MILSISKHNFLIANNGDSNFNLSEIDNIVGENRYKIIIYYYFNLLEVLGTLILVLSQ